MPVALKSPPTLVLASTSRYRRELLGRLGIAFTSIAPGIDETAHRDEQSCELVARLARAKALAVAPRYQDAWVIGSDQVAVMAAGTDDEKILGKPATPARCVAQLIESSGQTLTFLTAVALTRQHDCALFEFIDSTRVNFRVFDAATARRYVEKESPLDCAGGFKSEGLGITLCESISTADPTALIGLPLVALSSMLRSVGYSLP